MLEKMPNPLGFSQSLGVPRAGSSRSRRRPQHPPGRPVRVSADKLIQVDSTVAETIGTLVDPAAEEGSVSASVALGPLVQEWLADLEIQGGSDQTIHWYRHKMRGFLSGGEPRTLPSLTGAALKGYLAGLQHRGLSPDTAHGCFATIRAVSCGAST